MIITCKKQIPGRWIIFAILPWASFSFNGGVTSAAFVFSLKKFVDNPAGLTFILSLPAFVSIVLAPIISFLSDRIWTRFGRRKPFIVTSWIGIICCLALMPVMPNFWSLLVVYILNSIFADFNSPMEPLKQEIIPPHERGRATGAMAWCNNLANMLFYFVMLGRFDDVTFMDGLPIAGEQVIYWSAGLLMMVMLFLILLGIKEINPKSALQGQRLSIKTFFGGLLDPELWPVYILVFGSATLASGLGPLANLLYTDQWGYTKQEYGINIAVGGAINIFIIGLLTIFADRLNRMRAYRFLICLSVAINALYYCYVHFVLPDRRPTLVEMIVFGEVGAMIGLLTAMVYVPLVYDYVTRNKMGTYSAGANMVTKVTSLITLNGVGLFIWGYATLFQPPAGEMARIVLCGEYQKEEISATVKAASWAYPQNGNMAYSASVHAAAWQANGVISDTGRCWEFRLRNKDSERLAAQRETFEKEKSPLISEEHMLRDKAAVLAFRHKSSAALATEEEREKIKCRIDEISGRISVISEELSNRAYQFEREVSSAFGNLMMPDGSQILSASISPVLLMELLADERPDVHSLEKILADLRRELPCVIDIRPLRRESGYGVAVSATITPGTDKEVLASNLQSTLERVSRKYEPYLLTAGEQPIRCAVQRALTMDLQLVENPVTTYVSPITRLVNGVLSWFDYRPDPQRKLAALARNVREPIGISHIRVEPSQTPNAISVTAVLASNEKNPALRDGSAIARRLRALLGARESNETMRQVEDFYSRIEKTASTLRITVARPVLTVSYAPIQYDYMSGYLWMFCLGIVGICITIAFSRLEAKGMIRKRGIEESQAS